MPYVPSKRKTKTLDESIGKSLDLPPESSDLQSIPTGLQQNAKTNNIAMLKQLDSSNGSSFCSNSDSKNVQHSLHVESSQLPSLGETTSNIQVKSVSAKISDINDSIYTLENHSLSDVGKSLSNYNHTSKDAYHDSIPRIDHIQNNTEIRKYASRKPDYSDIKENCERSLDTAAQTNSTFFIPSPIKDDNIPLSLSFLRKPARSGSMDIDVDRIMKQNTLLNSKVFDSSNSLANCSIDTETPGSPISPLLSEAESANTHERRNSYINPLVRKKSGELVKSSLKLSSAFETSGAVSLPTTPTYKQVHFGTDIAVKYFDEKDKPISISADNSPCTSDIDVTNESDNSNSGDETELAYYGLNSNTNNSDYSNFLHRKLYDSANRVVENESQPHLEKFKFEMQRWNLDISQFKTISYRDKLDCELPVFLERCFINLEKTAVIGQIAVKNISFSKKVIIRYTIDDWVAIENVEAHYTSDVPRVLKKAGYDRFIFSLPTAQLICKFYEANKFENSPEIKFCIQYTAGGHDYWDNNHTKNYTLQFFEERKLQGKEKQDISPISTSGTAAYPFKNSNCYFTQTASKVGTSSNITEYDPNYSPISKGLTLKRSKSFDNKKSVKCLPNSSPPNNSLCLADNIPVEDKNSPWGETELKHNYNENIVNKKSECSSEGSLKDTIYNVSAVEEKTAFKQSATENDPENGNYNKEIYPQSGIMNSKLHQTIDKNKKECTYDNKVLSNDKEKGMNDKSYKTLVEKYCFFNGPSTVSPFGNDSEEDCSYFYDSKFY